MPFLNSDPSLAPLYDDVECYRSGLYALLGPDFAALVPSHGDPLDTDSGRARIDQSLQWVDDVVVHTRSLLRSRGSLDVAERALSIGTELGELGGVCLPTVQMVRAYLAALTREGLVSPRWSPATGAQT